MKKHKIGILNKLQLIIYRQRLNKRFLSTSVRPLAYLLAELLFRICHCVEDDKTRLCRPKQIDQFRSTYFEWAQNLL